MGRAVRRAPQWRGGCRWRLQEQRRRDKLAARCGWRCSQLAVSSLTTPAEVMLHIVQHFSSFVAENRKMLYEVQHVVDN
ncbi:hypothetical protein SAMN05518855_1004171 [Paenibacillus sp. CF384]|nr:hypothetical protein SAMN05518855_1004171 [Paenibacillus sp. CF384]